MGRGDTVLEDRLNHASLLDGGLASRAKFKRYAHSDVTQLDSLLTQATGNKLIVTDGVFSMDGDIAPLPELVRTAKARAAWLMVDDAHGLGVLGAHGGGLLEQFGLSQDDVPILMGTLGKGFGTFGAFVAGSELLIETLIQSARTYIYTTALPPAVAEATRASLQLIKTETWRREKLTALITQFRTGAAQLGLSLLPSASPIQPIMLGDSHQSVAFSNALLTAGFLVSAIRPPTVAQGTARLRVTLSAAHDAEQVEQLLDAIDNINTQ
jgi:8-amino-7-oxononanoate synthase